MKFLRLLSFFFLNSSIAVFAQEKMQVDSLISYRTTLPNGLYKTKSDFLNRTPSDTGKLVPKGLLGLSKKELTKLEQGCFFYTAATDKKVTNVFAVVYDGYLYFQVAGILKNRNKTDRSQSNNQPNGFVAVIYGGDNYLYTEASLVNAWAYGATVNAGVVGGIAAQDMIKGKGIVWDFKNEEFNIFKSCKDFNEFIKDKKADGVQECENHQPDMFEVRRTIKSII